MPNTLIADDDMDDLMMLADAVREVGFSVETADELEKARDGLLSRMPDVAILNEKINGESTLDLLEQLDLSDVMEIYLTSTNRSVDSAVRAMRLGVSDYIRKPVDRDRIISNLKTLAERIDCSVDQDEVLKNARGLMVGESAVMRRLYRMIRKSAPSDASILLIGESGSGKELVAQTIHALSDRAACELVSVNCSAIAKDLVESELFGHVKGSFTGATTDHKGFFQRAGGGTLFLDEITEMDPALQAKLLRVLESQSIRPVGGEKDLPVDVRIVAATNQELEHALSADELRQDLYYRLAQFPIHVPPLRDRRDDIELLAQHFLEEQNEATGLDKKLSQDVLEAFRLYDWPGNVRELKNAVVHGHLLAADEIAVDDLPDLLKNSAHRFGPQAVPGVGASVHAVERHHILKTLEHYEGDKKRAAESLGVSLKTLYNRLNEYEKGE